VLAEVAKLTVDERCRLLRHKHLSSMAGRRDPGTAVDIDAHITFVREERRPRVQTDAHPDRARLQCLGQFGGGGERSGRRRKRDEERIALGIDLHAIVTGTRLSDDLPVCGKRLGVGLRSQLVQELRRPLDVGEEKRDSAGGKLLMHAA
jgi:hypothetical protein